MEYNQIRQKRIQKELKDLFSDKLEDNGIYYEIDEDNINIIKIMMIGTKNTPYENGFYFFTIRFPSNYPSVPVKVWYYTTHPNMRFNPNLYNRGKVCLSIINTWGSRDNWTEDMTAKSVMLSIQSMVLTEEPLKNEPGLLVNNESIKQYNSVLYYCVFNTAIYDVLTKPQTKLLEITNESVSFECFKPIINKYFIDNIDWYMKRLKILNFHYKNKIVKFNRPFLQSKFICNYDVLYEKYEKLYIELTNKKINNVFININDIVLNDMKVIQLKNICKKNKIRKYSKLRKYEIIELINTKSENNEIMI